jgi:hypothetical protein
VTTATQLVDGVTRVPLPIGIHGIESVNAYVLADGDRVTLVDCGVWRADPDDDGLPALERGLHDAGYALADVSRIIVTHAHIDHYGLAGRLMELTGAELYMQERPARPPGGALRGGHPGRGGPHCQRTGRTERPTGDRSRHRGRQDRAGRGDGSRPLNSRWRWLRAGRGGLGGEVRPSSRVWQPRRHDEEAEPDGGRTQQVKQAERRNEAGVGRADPALPGLDPYLPTVELRCRPPRHEAVADRAP